MKLLLENWREYLNEISIKDIHKRADELGISWDDDAGFMKRTKELTGESHLDDLTDKELSKVYAALGDWREDLQERVLEPIEDVEISDVPHGLDFTEVSAHLSNHFGKAKITLTDSPLELERNYEQSDTLKPNGIWYGCGTTWLDFIDTQMLEKRPTFGAQIWALKIDMSRVLPFLSENAVERFTRRFRDEEKYVLTRQAQPDWTLAAAKFDGIECCPYPVGDWEFKMKYMWYYGIDMSSGCIWNTKAITNSMLAAELKEDGWEVYV
jgi:hypothetical protein